MPICLLVNLAAAAQPVQAIKGHSHNDYEQERPLLMALENGMVSVEVDVHLVEGQLYVSHDPPKKLEAGRTLEALYLEPLRAHILENNGEVYPGHEGLFYLMIDFKTAAKPTYEALKAILPHYRELLAVVRDGEEKGGPVKVFISGNRPIEQLLAEKVQLAGLDGRPDDLAKNYPTASMPVVSSHYRNIFHWREKGEIKNQEMEELKELVETAHEQGKKVRLWATPDKPEVWQFLIENGLDFINTDLPKAFKEFYLERY